MAGGLQALICTDSRKVLVYREKDISFHGLYGCPQTPQKLRMLLACISMSENNSIS
jgi:hypothetical protein